MKRNTTNNRRVFGILAICVGIVLLLNAAGIIDAYISVGMFWPIIIIVFGIKSIVVKEESTFIGGIVTIVGVIFQLRNLGMFGLENVDIWNLLIPCIIILVGIKLILPKKEMSE